MCARAVGGDHPRIESAGAGQFIMCSLFDDPPLVEYQDAIGAAYRIEPVRDHQQGAVERQLVDAFLDQTLALGVEVGRGLVEDHQRGIAQKGAGQGDALDLPARESRAALADRAVIAQRQGVDEFSRPCAPGRLAHRVQIRLGTSEPDVVGDRALEQARLLRHPGQMTAPVLQIDPGERLFADQDASSGRNQEPEQQIDHRGLARAAGADQRNALPRRDVEVETLERLASRLITEMHVLEAHTERTGGGQRLGARIDAGRLGVQHLDQLFGGGHRAHTRMILGAQIAQRRIELGGEHQHEQPLQIGDLGDGDPGRHRHRQTIEPEADQDRDDGDADAGEELQHRRGQKGHAQHLHGAVAIVVGDARDDGDLASAGAEELERGQALDDVEEVRAHARELFPLALITCLGPRADQDHEQRDQRRREQQHQPGEPVHRHHGGEDGQGQDHHQRHGRDEAGVIALQVVDALGQGLDQGAAALAGEIGRPEPLQMTVHLIAQCGAHRGGGLEGRALGEPDDERARAEERQQSPQPVVDLGQVGVLEDDGIQDHGQRPGLIDGQQTVGRVEPDGQQECLAGERSLRFEPGVD